MPTANDDKATADRDESTGQRDESTILPNDLTNHQLKRPMQPAAATEQDDELAAQR